MSREMAHKVIHPPKKIISKTSAYVCLDKQLYNYSVNCTLDDDWTVDTIKRGIWFSGGTQAKILKQQQFAKK